MGLEAVRKWVVTTAPEVGRAGAMRALEEVLVLVEVVEVVIVVCEVEGMGARVEEEEEEDSVVVVVVAGAEGDVLEGGGEAVIWGLTITVVVELWTPGVVKSVPNLEMENSRGTTYILRSQRKHILVHSSLRRQQQGNFDSLERNPGLPLNMSVRYRNMQRRLVRYPLPAGNYLRSGSSYWAG